MILQFILIFIYTLWISRCIAAARERIPGSIDNYVTGVSECSQQRGNLKDDGYRLVNNGGMCMKLWQFPAGVLLAVALVGCNAKGAEVVDAQVGKIENPMKRSFVEGNINILQRIALPADAVLTVALSDVSLADAPSVTLSQKVERLGGKQSPFHFVLPYQPNKIKPNARIVVRASVSLHSRLMFVTDTAYEVINNGKTKDVEITLKAVR
ncbi:YbaY family lipoprotein [Photorhabdus bodei]|nr:YbaY family lipoprotein [Photorhabdus bodei]